MNIKVGSPIIYLSIYQEYENFGSCSYKVLEIPPLAICRRGTQKCLCCDSSPSPNLRTRGVHDVSASPRAGEKSMSQLKQAGGKQKGLNTFSLCLFILFRPSTDRLMPAHTGESGAICFTWSRDLNTNLILKDLCRHTRACWTRGPVRLTHKTDHHSK